LHEVSGTRNQRAFQEKPKIAMPEGSKRPNGPESLHKRLPSLKC
jgi:hypothetical protein